MAEPHVTNPLAELLVDGEVEVAAGRGHWPYQRPQRTPRPRPAYRRALYAIWKARQADADRLREIARKALNMVVKDKSAKEMEPKEFQLSCLWCEDGINACEHIVEVYRRLEREWRIRESTDGSLQGNASRQRKTESGQSTDG